MSLASDVPGVIARSRSISRTPTQVPLITSIEPEGTVETAVRRAAGSFVQSTAIGEAPITGGASIASIAIDEKTLARCRMTPSSCGRRKPGLA